MSLTILRVMLVSGIIGHALNLYCDRILSVFPNGTLKLKDIKDIGTDNKMAVLMNGVSEKIPMRSAILGAFALMFEFFGYFAIAAYVYGHSKLYGSILFVAIVLFVIIGTAHHVKTALVEYVFLKLGRNDTAKSLMLDLFHDAPITRICFIGYIVFTIVLIIAILSGAAALPLWAALFTVLPIFILMYPFRIIGTLHISAMISMLAWIFLL